MQEFHELLNPHVLTASYGQRDGVRPYPLTEAYYKAPLEVDDDEFDLVFFPAMMDPAPGNISGGEARLLSPGQGTTRRAAVFPQFNKIQLPGDALLALREPDSPALQKKGATTVNRIFDDFGERHNIYRELVIARTLTEGLIYANAAGQILENSTGAAVTIDFGIDSSHKGNLGGIIDVQWSDPTADIAHHIEAIKDAAEAANAEQPTDIWLHTIRKRDLRNNAKFVQWASFNQKVTDVVLQGDIIEGLWGMTWHFYGGKYRGVDGAMHDYIPQTGGFLAPPADRPWVRPVQGKTLVPMDLNVVSDWRKALDSAEEMYGRFAYAKLTDDPMALWLYMGDKFGLYFADPNAIWMPTLFS